jgi:hypothetical protein
VGGWAGEEEWCEWMSEDQSARQMGRVIKVSDPQLLCGWRRGGESSGGRAVVVVVVEVGWKE